MTLDIAMGGSTNTVLHLLAAAHEAGDRLHHGRHRPAVAPGAVPVQGRAVEVRRPHGGRPPRRRHHGDPRRARARRPDRRLAADRPRRDAWPSPSASGTSAAPTARACASSSCAAPGGVPTQTAFSQERRYDSLDLDRENGVIRDDRARLLEGRRPRRALRQPRRERRDREDRRRRCLDPGLLRPGAWSSRARTRR